MARLAEVSVGTVSNVLNRPDSVGQERRRRVAAAIDALGFVPNDAARALRRGIPMPFVEDLHEHSC